MRELTVNTGWTAHGRIELIGNELLPPVPPLPDCPGLYRLRFNGTTAYFGETSDLRRRIGDYLLYYQATGIESEFRINKALQTFKGADVLIATGDDLQSRSQRCSIESRLIQEAKDQGLKVLNGGSLTDRIAFHASEIIRLTTKLERSSHIGSSSRNVREDTV